MTVIRVHLELADDLKMILAPILGIDERVVERDAVITYQSVALPQCLCRLEHVRLNNLSQKTFKLRIRKTNAVQFFKLLLEISF